MTGQERAGEGEAVRFRQRLGAAWVAQLFFLSVALSGAITFTSAVTTPALASCTTSTLFNFSVSASPGFLSYVADGSYGHVDVQPSAISLGHGNIYVESQYIIHDASNIVEWGWDVQLGVFTTTYGTFDARAFDGAYVIRWHAWDSTSPSLTVGNHEFREAYNATTGKYSFALDGSWMLFYRDPVWRYGEPNAAVESKSTCDTGSGHFWGLHYRSDAPWHSWFGTNWSYDDQPNWGYDAGSAATEFYTSARTDNWAPGCNYAHDYTFC